MAAYVISEVEVLDEDSFEQYRCRADLDREHGGRYLVRAALPRRRKAIGPGSRRLVIVEFPDMDAPRRWYSSESYAEALAFRDRALTRRLLFVGRIG